MDAYGTGLECFTVGTNLANRERSCHRIAATASCICGRGSCCRKVTPQIPTPQKLQQQQLPMRLPQRRKVRSIYLRCGRCSSRAAGSTATPHREERQRDSERIDLMVGKRERLQTFFSPLSIFTWWTRGQLYRMSKSPIKMVSNHPVIHVVGRNR